MTSTRLVTGDAFEGIQAARNYLRGSSFELGVVQGWATYADAAATTPVDGTGGSPNVTFTAQTGSLVRGTFSGRLTKDAANRQGQGASYDFTIDAADTGRPVMLSFDFLAGGSYAANDVGVYIYDVTNNTLITPSAINVAAGKGTFRAFFVATTSTSYRLILHVASTNASAWTLDTDNFQVGPQMQLSGAAVTDWMVSTAPAGNWFVTGPTNVTTIVNESRIGDSVELDYSIKGTGSSAAFSELEIKLPYTIDTTKLPARASTGETFIGTGEIFRNGQARRTVTAFITSGAAGTSFLVRLENDAAADPTSITNTSPITWDSTAQFHLRTIRLPVANWSSNVTSLASANPEYAYNSSTSTGTDTNSANFANGLLGASLQAFAPAGTASIQKRVRFQTPIQPTDKLKLKLKSVGATAYIDLDDRLAGFSINDAGTTYYGYQIVQVNSTDVDVYFYSQVAPGINWGSALGTWVLEKQSPLTEGILPVTARAVVGDTTGTAVPQGFIGEKIPFTNRTTTGSTAAVVSNATPLATLTAGVWTVYGRAVIPMSNAASFVSGHVATNSAADFTGRVASAEIAFNNVTTAANLPSIAMFPEDVVVVGSAGQDLFAKSFSEDAAINVEIRGFAVRIA